MLTLDDWDYNGSLIMYSKQHVFPLLTAILSVTNSAKSEGRGDMENSVKKKILPTLKAGRDISSSQSYPCRRDRPPNFALFVMETMDVSKGKHGPSTR